MSRATITDSGGDRVILRTPYNARFRDDLLRTIPHRSREWSKAGRRWFINRECLPRLEALCRRHFEHVQVNRPLPTQETKEQS